MRIFGLFRKSKKEEETKMQDNQATEVPNAADQPPAPEPNQAQEVEAKEPENGEKQETSAKTYLKAMPLRDLADLENIKSEVKSGNILILKITPLANKSIQDVSKAVDELYHFTELIGGDIARLGEERIVICPPKIKIWREKSPATNGPVPTAA